MSPEDNVGCALQLSAAKHNVGHLGPRHHAPLSQAILNNNNNNIGCAL